jgi:hypothetical protein
LAHRAPAEQIGGMKIRSQILLVGCALALSAGAGRVVAQTWDGGGGNDRWNTANNWSPNGTPSFNNSTTLTFSGSTRTSPDMNGNRTVNRIVFGSAAAGFTLLGDNGPNSETLTFAGTLPRITQLSANDQVMLMNRIRWTQDGIITVSGAGSLTLGDGSTTAGRLYGNGDITKAGTGGSLILYADNSNWSGSLLIGAGTVRAAYADTALGTGTVSLSAGATLELADTGQTVSQLAGAGLVDFGLAGTGGSLILYADNSNWSGSLLIGAGTVRAAYADTALGTGTVSLSAAATLELADTGQTVSQLAGAGLVDFGLAGTGALTLDGGVSVFGGTFTGAGTIVLGAGATLALGADFSAPGLNLVLAGGTLRLEEAAISLGQLTITADSVLDFNGPDGSSLDVTDIFFDTLGLKLTVDNWLDSVNFFRTDNFSGVVPDERGAAPQNQIVFTGYDGNDTAWLAYDRQITPVPEPVLGLPLLAGALALVLWRKSRAHVSPASRRTIPAGIASAVSND